MVNTPMAAAVVLQPKRSGWSGSIAHASTGTSVIPPITMPSIVRAIAMALRRLNQWFSAVITGRKAPRPEPRLKIRYAR